MWRTASAEVLARAWERSVALMEAQGVVWARSLLHLLSTFAPAPIPVGLLLPGVICAEQELEAAVNGLLGFGLVRVEHNPAALVLHPFVRELVVPQSDSWVPMCDKLLFEVAKATNPVDWALWDLLLPRAVTPTGTAESLVLPYGTTTTHSRDQCDREGGRSGCPAAPADRSDGSGFRSRSGDRRPSRGC